MKTPKKKKTALAKKPKAKFQFYRATYQWTPPTPEEIVKQKAEDIKRVVGHLREIAIYLEGVMHSPTSRMDRGINRQHLSTLWSVIDKNQKPE